MPELNENIAPAINIAPALFLDNKLIRISFSCWTATATIKDGDEGILGVQSLDGKFFKRGGIILADKDRLEPFLKKQRQIAGWLSTMGTTFNLIPGSYIFTKDYVEKVMEELDKHRLEIDRMAEEFVRDYPAYRDNRIREFNEAHPEVAGRLDRYFSETQNLDKLRRKFGLSYFWIRIADDEECERIIQNEQNLFRTHMRSFAADLAAEFRRSAVEAALAFKKGIDNAGQNDTGMVNSRSVTAFKSFLERMERHNFLKDRQMTAMLQSMREKVLAVGEWNVNSDPATMSVIKAHLDEVVRVGQEEGAAQGVVSSLIGLSAMPEESFEIEQSPEMHTGPSAPPTLQDGELPVEAAA